MAAPRGCDQTLPVSWSYQPGHAAFIEGSLISEYGSAVPNPAVMHHGRVAQRAPGYQHGHAAHDIVHHFTVVENTEWIRLGVAVDDQPNYRFVILKIGYGNVDEHRVVDGWYVVGSS